MRPIVALDRAIERAMVVSDERRPGVVIQRLPAETRAALEGLTSADALNVRLPYVAAHVRFANDVRRR